MAYVLNIFMCANHIHEGTIRFSFLEQLILNQRGVPSASVYMVPGSSIYDVYFADWRPSGVITVFMGVSGMGDSISLSSGNDARISSRNLLLSLERKGEKDLRDATGFLNMNSVSLEAK